MSRKKPVKGKQAITITHQCPECFEILEMHENGKKEWKSSVVCFAMIPDKICPKCSENTKKTQ